VEDLTLLVLLGNWSANVNGTLPFALVISYLQLGREESTLAHNNSCV